MSLIKFLVTFLLSTHHVMASGVLHAEDEPSDWLPVDQIEWTGSMVEGNKFDLSNDYVHSYLDLNKYQGKWIRVSAETSAGSSDFNIWIYALNADGRPLFKTLPTICKKERKKKTCHNYTWIPHEGDRVKIVIYQGAEPSVVMIGGVEQSSNVGGLNSSKKRFLDISDEVRRLFYSKDKIDWDEIVDEIIPSLGAPQDIDPVPMAVSQMISRLPGNNHSYIFLKDKNHAPNDIKLPSCTPIGNGQWRLDMPKTPSGRRYGLSYISRAHKCLSEPNVSLWIVNMTENGGGDFFMQASALAPLFGSSPLIKFLNRDDDSFLVELRGASVFLSGEIILSRRPLKFNHPKDAIFVLGPGCGSSCEAIAIAAKGRFKTVGKPTAGFATVNETILIGNDYALAITSGVMADLKGDIMEKVIPDIEISYEEIEGLLKNGYIE